MYCGDCTWCCCGFPFASDSEAYTEKIGSGRKLEQIVVHVELVYCTSGIVHRRRVQSSCYRVVAEHPGEPKILSMVPQIAVFSRL
jgi:hypothetical protein